jgi:reverse gyrase
MTQPISVAPDILVDPLADGRRFRDLSLVEQNEVTIRVIEVALEEIRQLAQVVRRIEERGQ